MHEEYQLKAQGRLAACREIIKSYDAQVQAAPHWVPGAALQSECRKALELLGQMQERLDRKLVVTLVGPSGAGKSTLLNALAGKDDLSPVGIERPTTTGVTIFCQSKSDADVLLQELGHEVATIQTGPVAAGLKNVLLVDTPDMDSTDSGAYRSTLEQTISLSDILFCVLNAENPKRRDTIVFMKRYVDLYPGSQLCVVLNRCDRLQEEELKQTILPDLKKHLQAAWQRPVEFVFCISARSNLQQPQWPDGENPLHDYDDFAHLHAYVFGSLNRGSRFVDARIERAEHLVEVRLVVRIAYVERLDDRVEVVPLRPLGDDRARRIVEGNATDRVVLSQHQVGQAGRQPRGLLPDADAAGGLLLAGAAVDDE